MYRYQKGFEKEGNVLFNDALNTFYLQIYGRKYFYVTTYSTHFIYLASDTDIWCDIMVKVHSDSEGKPAAATTLATRSD